MGLRFDPMGGGQFKMALQQIIEAERQPVRQLEARKKIEETKVKLFQEFKGKFANFDKNLSEFTNFRKFRELKVDLGDGASHIDVTVDKERAEPGTFQLEIDQLARRASVISNGFAEAEEPNLGIGFVVVRAPDGEKKEIFIDAKESSLRGIASAINRTDGLGVHASVVNDQTDSTAPWKLIVASKTEGLTDSVVIPEFYFMDGSEEIWFEDSNDADNAIIRVDGFEIEAPSNDLKDFMSGINVKLKQPRPGLPLTVTLTEDYQKVAGKVKGMIDQVNGILDFINKQNAIDEKSDTRASFAGDSSLQSVEYRLRNLMHEGFPVWDNEDSDEYRFVFLNQMGVEFEKNGQMTFKEDKFIKAMQKDFAGISQAITGEQGIAVQLKTVMQGYTRMPDGMIGIREQAFKNRINQIDQSIADKERRIEQRQQRLTEQFSRLQASLSNMQKQQQYLSSTLGGGGGNLVAQMLGG